MSLLNIPIGDERPFVANQENRFPLRLWERSEEGMAEATAFLRSYDSFPNSDNSTLRLQDILLTDEGPILSGETRPIMPALNFLLRIGRNQMLTFAPIQPDGRVPDYTLLNKDVRYGASIMTRQEGFLIAPKREGKVIRLHLQNLFGETRDIYWTAGPMRYAELYERASFLPVQAGMREDRGR